MGPCVNTDVMPSHVLFDKNLGTFDDAGSDNEKCSYEISCGEEVQQSPVRTMNMMRAVQQIK
jgi:hypothetical protein